MITTVQGVVGKLPPTVRDFAIYQYVKFDRNSTRDAAGAFQLSQTRVRQILARVTDFYIESVPQGADDDPTPARLEAAERLAREHLEYLYQRALMAFENSGQEDEHGNVSPGKVAYLAMAGRLVLWMSKIPLHPLVEFREDEEQNAREEAEDAPGTDEEMEQFKQEILAHAAKSKLKIETMRDQARRNVEAEQESVRRQVEAEQRERRAARGARHAERDGYGATPPNADCSASAVSSGPSAARAPSSDAVNIPAEGTYRTLDEIKAAARRDFLRPAQRAQSPERDTPPLGEREAMADEEVQPSQRPLTRKERRARARQLKRALAKR